MKIDTMQPEEGTPRVSAMERITAVADLKGAERRERIFSKFDRILGAPEAAREALKIVGERIDDFKDRTEKRIKEVADDLVERASNAYDRCERRVIEIKDKSVSKAKELGNRALKAGLTAGTWVENRVVAVCEIPAGIKESLAGGQEGKAGQASDVLSAKLVEQAKAQANLSEQQAAILKSLLAAQEAERQRLVGQQESVKNKISGRIERAREKATELRADAAASRANVEKRRVFRGWLQRVTG